MSKQAPRFWYGPRGVAGWLLSPLGLVYGSVSRRRMRRPASYRAGVPVLCVGNFIAGGSGKTPTAIALAGVARKLGYAPGFLSRGYGGALTEPTVVDLEIHAAKGVGDEPMLLAETAPTVVSADRAAGARLLEAQGIDLIIMDDGFQNPTLHKDYSLAVVDAGRGIGNGFVHPAGPLRAPLIAQIERSSALLIIGRSDAGTSIIRQAARAAKPVLSAALAVQQAERWAGVDVLAYCGIGDPSKFFTSLANAGAIISRTHPFGDHHAYTAEDCDALIEEAHRRNLVLATTTKDMARLRGAGSRQQALYEASYALEVELRFENPRMAELVIQNTFRAFASRSTKAKVEA